MSHILLKANVGTGGSGGSAFLSGLTDVNISSPLNGQAIVWSSGTSEWINAYASSGGTGGVTDHGLLTGLADNDHPQYTLSGTFVNHTADTSVHFTTGNVETQITGTTHLSFSSTSLTSTTFNVAYIDFDTSHVSEYPTEGRLEWNNDDGTLNVGMPGGNVALQVGQELIVRVRNTTGTLIPNGTVVKQIGVQADRPLISGVSASETVIPGSVAMATEDIDHNSNGYCTFIGLVRDLDTSSWTAGTNLYLSTTGGSMTADYPMAPNHRLWCAVVVRQHANEGIVYFRPGPALCLSCLADVNGTTPDSTNKYLVYDPTNEYWDANQIYFSGITNTGHTHGIGDITGFTPSDYTTDVEFDAHTGESSIHFTVGSIDHGSITGLTDNDHPQYRLTADTINFSEIGSTGHTHLVADITDFDPTDKADQSDFVSHTGESIIHFTVGSIDHGSITGLTDNDHPQYRLTANTISLSGDVAQEGATTGQVVTWDGANWIPSGVTAGGTGSETLSGLSDTTVVSPNDGDTLQYTGGSWVSSSAATAYVNSTPMPAAIHGIDAGTTWNNTIQEVLDAILYPYQAPAFTAFAINGQSTTIEVGASAATGSITFTWTTSNSSNVEPNTVDIRDTTQGFDLETNIADDSSQTSSYYGTSGITKTTNTFHRWTIDAEDTQATNFSRNFNVNWYWRFYWGSSVTTTADESLIEGLQNNSLYNSRGRTYTCDANNYKWICYPTSFGLASSFTDAGTGFELPMESPATVSVTNSYGVTTNYYAYRSTNPTAAELDIIVG